MSPDDTGGPGSWPPRDPTAAPAAPPPPPPPPPDQPAQWAPPPNQWAPPPPAMPPPVPVSQPPQWRSLSGLASALTVLFAVDAVAGVFAVLALANRLGVINDLENGN